MSPCGRTKGVNLAIPFYLTCVILSVYYYVMFYLLFVSERGHPAYHRANQRQWDSWYIPSIYIFLCRLRPHSIIAFSTPFSLATLKTVPLLFYSLLVPFLFKQKVVYPISVLSGMIAIVQLFIIAIYCYVNLNNGSQ